MKYDNQELNDLDPYLLPYERARVAKNLRYWQRKKRMTRAAVAQGIMPVNKLKAYEKDSRDISLPHIFALAARFEICGAAMSDLQKLQN